MGGRRLLLQPLILQRWLLSIDRRGRYMVLGVWRQSTTWCRGYFWLLDRSFFRKDVRQILNIVLRFLLQISLLVLGFWRDCILGSVLRGMKVTFSTSESDGLTLELYDCFEVFSWVGGDWGDATCNEWDGSGLPPWRLPISLEGEWTINHLLSIYY